MNSRLSAGLEAMAVVGDERAPIVSGPPFEVERLEVFREPGAGGRREVGELGGAGLDVNDVLREEIDDFFSGCKEDHGGAGFDLLAERLTVREARERLAFGEGDHVCRRGCGQSRGLWAS